MSFAVDDTPKAKIFRERIGDREYELREERLDVLNDVVLWDRNPRLRPHIAETNEIASEEDLEAFLRDTKGYDALAKSIADVGQMEAIYAWRREDQPKFIVIEGATRVTILRDRARRHLGKPDEAGARIVRAKILPPEFSEEERAILLAKIHVRGTGVRAWGRYIEARFVHETVSPINGNKPTMSVTELAKYMGKSISWVSRLKDAYQFAQKFVEQIDSPDAERLAVREFSTLEEIAKCSGIGPKLRDYEAGEHDQLRADVFEMVRSDVFKEYRDARFMREFYEDPEKWALLKTGERHIANRLANDVRSGNKSLKAKITGLPVQIERAIEREPDFFDDDDLDQLRGAIRAVEAAVHPDVNQFRLELVAFTRVLENASLDAVKSVQHAEIERFDEALEDFRGRLEKHKSWK